MVPASINNTDSEIKGLVNNPEFFKQNAISPNINRKSSQKMKVVGRTDPYLTQDVIQKMLIKILDEKKGSREEISKTLGITARELNRLFLYMAPLALIVKINLPLVRLFCEARL